MAFLQLKGYFDLFDLYYAFTEFICMFTACMFTAPFYSSLLYFNANL